jgi:hypothetical protein
MTYFHGKDGLVKIGAPSAVTLKVENWSFEEQLATDDVSHQGDPDDGTRDIGGRVKTTGNFTAVQDKANTQQNSLQVGQTVTVELYDGGIGSGAKYHKGEALITSRGRDVPKDGAIRTQIGWNVQGRLAEQTVGGGS